MSEQPEAPHPPYTPEDIGYQAIVNEYAGLLRAGADPLSAALITAAHLVILGKANQQQGEAG